MSVTGAIPTTGALIWISVKPLFRVLIPGGIGFALSKNGVFPPTGPRIASMLILYCTLPALLFSKIVPSFDSENISALGPIILAAFFYQAFNFATGIVVRATCQTPRQFRWGLISAFTFSNWGDLPTAVSQAITSQSPFNGIEDENLAIAYIAIFLLVNYISMFPLQGVMLIKKDYDVSRYTPEQLAKERRREDSGGWRKWVGRIAYGKPMGWEINGGLAPGEKEKLETEEEAKITDDPTGVSTSLHLSANASITFLPSQTAPPPPAELFPNLSPMPSFEEGPSNSPHAHMRVFHSITTFLKSLITPPTTSLLAALIIALVPPLKALFIAPSDGSFHPVAPDGLPPLAIIYDTATFVGAASVPLGLLVLGASLAKMVIPRPVKKLPLAGIAAMAVVKMAILPIVGFAFCERLVRAGMVPESNKVLRFVTIFFSCVPTATTQIAYSQIFGPANGKNNADLLAAYLIAQYATFAISSVILTAFTLSSIF